MWSKLKDSYLAIGVCVCVCMQMFVYMVGVTEKIHEGKSLISSGNFLFELKGGYVTLDLTRMSSIHTVKTGTKYVYTVSLKKQIKNKLIQWLCVGKLETGEI